MRRPEFTRLLTLEERVRIADGAGGAAETWTALGTHWAEVLPRGAIERSFGGIEASVVTHRVTIRWAEPGSPARPTARQRFRDGERVYEILGAADADARGRFLIVWVREGLPL